MGWLLKVFQNSKLVYDCHEYWPEKIANLAPAIFQVTIKRIFRSIERFFSGRADIVWAVNEHLAQRFSGLSKPVIVLPNYPTMELFGRKHDPPTRLREQFKNKKVLIYIGGLTEVRGISACLQVTALLKANHPDIQTLFIGSFGYKYEQIMPRLIDDLDISNHVTIIENVDHEKIPGYLKLGDLGLFIVQPVNERFSWGEPIKYFEYMAAGLPVVISDLPAKRRLIEAIGNGILVNPLDHSETANAIHKLLSDNNLRNVMSRKGSAAFQDQYHWEFISERMINSLISFY
jgi:glycosyltransferase involved in cell wall biosynthesis